MSDTEITLNVTAFKATCLDLFERLNQGTLTRIVVTKRGDPIAIVEPTNVPNIEGSAWGFMRGSMRIAPGVDLTEPVIDDEPDDPFIGKGKADDAAA